MINSANYIEVLISKLDQEDRKWLQDFGTEPVPRKLMNTIDIKKANSFVKLGLLNKGTSDDKYKSVIYYVDSWVDSKLY